jgi:hypothetical protein
MPEGCMSSGISIGKAMNSIFFHPDCTVGSGIAPDRPEGSRTFTAGRELHPALKIYRIQFGTIIRAAPGKSKCFFQLPDAFISKK